MDVTFVPSFPQRIHQIISPHPHVNQRVGALRVLFRFDHHPAIIIRQFREDPAVIDPAIARHGKDAGEDGAEEAPFANIRLRAFKGAEVFGVDVFDACSVGACQFGGVGTAL